MFRKPQHHVTAGRCPSAFDETQVFLGNLRIKRKMELGQAAALAPAANMVAGQDDAARAEERNPAGGFDGLRGLVNHDEIERPIAEELIVEAGEKSGACRHEQASSAACERIANERVTKEACRLKGNGHHILL